MADTTNAPEMPDFLDPSFPASQEAPEGMQTVRLTDNSFPLIDVRPGLIYQSLSGEDQHIHLFLPTRPFPVPGAVTPEPCDPLIIYVPGSAWMRQAPWMGLSKAVDTVRRGYAFAIVEYRPSEVACFPAHVEDAKSAIRYLRLHAREFGVDPERFALWGDSSGGHTVTMAAVTGDTQLDGGQNPGASLAVRCVVDWFGPTDIGEMHKYPSAMDHLSAGSPEGMLLGGKAILDAPEAVQAANPIHYLTRDTSLPPFLIMHGDKDNVVPFNQSVLLYQALRAAGKDVTFFKLAGAGHGVGGFASSEANGMALDFIAQHMK